MTQPVSFEFPNRFRTHKEEQEHLHIEATPKPEHDRIYLEMLKQLLNEMENK